MLIDQFSPYRLTLLEMPACDARYILAARSWCLLRKAAMDPHSRLLTYLHSERRVVRFSLFMETVTQIWPEPFALHRPCCAMPSVDEMVMVQALRWASLRNRPQFERLLHEMLGDDARDLLYAQAAALDERST
ncbi:MAG TPA: hypothetical protein PKK17_00950 [Sphingorhabdus lacus]|jgi:hypothetical protein|nr:hypothetical protein [Sphingorhabdus lacus]HPV66717.1 hypothetical protein [Sphingorhabdus lacus]